MAIYTIASSKESTNTLRNAYSLAKQKFHFENYSALDSIFEIGLVHRDRFPNFHLSGKVNEQIYLERWIKSYYDAMSNLPSKRIASPKSSCSDPAIKTIVQFTQNISDSDSSVGEQYHNLFMSAENIQGSLLEEYIAIHAECYGFLWCNGNVLRAIDFCNTDGSFFLQIKNKSNTENSSSSNIREGTSIEKWYRLGTHIKDGQKYPDYKWNSLNALLFQHMVSKKHLPAPNLNESDYQRFLAQVSSQNKNLITSL